MSRTQIVEIGTIKRVHGVAGEFQIALTPNTQPTELNKLESVFILIDAIPVPFFIENIRGNSPDIVIVKFDTINSANEAVEFVGLKVMANLKRKKVRREISLEDLAGFQLIDQVGSLIGAIVAYEEYSANAVFFVKDLKGNEVIIPASEEIILDVNLEARSITVQLPEGLLDIYS